MNRSAVTMIFLLLGAALPAVNVFVVHFGRSLWSAEPLYFALYPVVEHMFLPGLFPLGGTLTDQSTTPSAFVIALGIGCALNAIIYGLIGGAIGALGQRRWFPPALIGAVGVYWAAIIAANLTNLEALLQR